MKQVVFFHCKRDTVKPLIDEFTGRYDFVVVTDPSSKTGKQYLENPLEGVAIVEAPFLKDTHTTHQPIVDALAAASYVIVHLEYINPHLMRYYEYISDEAKQWVPTKEALANASDKRLMRTALSKNAPQITPFNFSLRCDDLDFLQKAMSLDVEFPLMIKPANNMSSLFVTRVNNREEYPLKLKEQATLMRDFYATRSRHEDPTVVIEGYLEGDMYTVASWVDTHGKYWHMPLVRVITAEDIGIDDFHLYCRHTTPLDNKLQQEAQKVVERATDALGLRNSSLHAELILTQNGFKVIEVGARVGGHRQWMLQTSYNIDCFKNDFLIRTGSEPTVNNVLLKHSAVLHLYPPKAGKIVAIKGVDSLQKLQSFALLHERKKPPYDALPSGLGGTRAIELSLAHSNFNQLKADISTARDLLQYEYQ